MMGTRNLTMVVLGGKIVISQYGQWDGYPSGNGIRVKKFLENADLGVFTKQIAKVKVISKEEFDQILSTFKKTSSSPGSMSLEDYNKFSSEYPSLTRDTGCGILDLVYNASDDEVLLHHPDTEFYKNSLFCEWAYLIDLDKEVLEVYEGFNKSPLTKNDRFFTKVGPTYGEYYPIRKIREYSIKELKRTSDEDFINELDPPN